LRDLLLLRLKTAQNPRARAIDSRRNRLEFTEFEASYPHIPLAQHFHVNSFAGLLARR
jgi:hypothetical protein